MIPNWAKASLGLQLFECSSSTAEGLKCMQEACSVSVGMMLSEFDEFRSCSLTNNVSKTALKVKLGGQSQARLALHFSPLCTQAHAFHFMRLPAILQSP